MGNNVIDRSEQFASRGNGRRGITDTPSLEDRLLSTARLPEKDKPKFAENLGKLASRIEPNNPLDSARRIVERSGLEGIWQKRKRYFRLPDEPAPALSRDGEYGSNAATFLKLAQAAGELLSASRQDEVVSRERSRAVRLLVEGTSFVSTFVPADATDRTAKALLDDYAAILSEAAVSRTRILDLWRILREAPFGLDAMYEEGARAAEESPFGDAARFPESLLRPLFNDHIVAARFNPSTNDSFGWANPTLPIGFVAIRRESRIFVVPEAKQELFTPERETEDGLIGKEARSWLESIGFADDALPEIQFKPERGFGWKPCTLSVLKKVGLTLTEADDGHACVEIHIWGYGPYAFSYSQSNIDKIEERLANSREFVFTQETAISTSTGDYFLAIRSDIFSRDDYPDYPPVIGLISTYDSDIHMEVAGWTNQEEAAALLLGNKFPFYPTLRSSSPVGCPICQGSVGAGLLQNARFAPGDDRITHMLIEKVQLTANAGLSFYEAMVDTYREALREI